MNERGNWNWAYYVFAFDSIFMIFWWGERVYGPLTLSLCDACISITWPQTKRGILLDLCFPTIGGGSCARHKFKADKCLHNVKSKNDFFLFIFDVSSKRMATRKGYEWLPVNFTLYFFPFELNLHSFTK